LSANKVIGGLLIKKSLLMVFKAGTLWRKG